MVHLLCREGVLQQYVSVRHDHGETDKPVPNTQAAIWHQCARQGWKHTSAGPTSALAARVACRLRAVAAFCCTHGTLPEKHALLEVREQAKGHRIIWQLFTPAVRTFQALSLLSSAVIFALAMTMLLVPLISFQAQANCIWACSRCWQTFGKYVAKPDRRS